MSELIKVKNPKKAGEFLLVNRAMFASGNWEAWSDKPAKKAPAKTASKARGGKRGTNKPKQDS